MLPFSSRETLRLPLEEKGLRLELHSLFVEGEEEEGKETGKGERKKN